MHTPADAVPLAAAYLRVILVALPGMYMYSFAMMALRGAGDAKTPLVSLFVSAVIDTGLNPLLARISRSPLTTPAGKPDTKLQQHHPERRAPRWNLYRRWCGVHLGRVQQHILHVCASRRQLV